MANTTRKSPPASIMAKSEVLASLRQQFSVTGIMIAPQMHGRFADGSGHHSRNFPGKGQIHGPENIFHHGRAACCGGMTIGNRFRFHAGHHQDICSSRIIMAFGRSGDFVKFQMYAADLGRHWPVPEDLRQSAVDSAYRDPDHCNALTIISGPMPVISPIVTAKSGRKSSAGFTQTFTPLKELFLRRRGQIPPRHDHSRPKPAPADSWLNDASAANFQSYWKYQIH